MYPNLYKRMNLKPEDLERYDLLLVSFYGKMVVSWGMIRLPIQTGDKEVQVNFIMVEAFSPYTTILARP